MQKHLTIVDHPVVQHKLSQMRDENTSTGQFRRLLKETGGFLTYEVTRDLQMTERTIQTPMQSMSAPFIAGKKMALISILRAGNGLLDGVLELIPSAPVGFVGFYRDQKTLKPVQYYFKAPPLQDRLVIVVDPMLATGNSSAAAIDLLKEAGATNIRFLCLLAAPEGVETMESRHPDVPIFTGSLDERLNENGYIIPGLGDAGDRIYGTK